MTKLRLSVGDVVESHGMSGRAQRWTVEAVSPQDIKLDGVWFRAGQVRQWLQSGVCSVTKGAERTEE